MSSFKDITAKVNVVNRQYRQAVEQIRGDRSLSPDGKAEKLGGLYVAARNEIARLRGELQQSRQEERKRLEQSLFGPRYPYAATAMDKVAIQNDYRATLDRAEQVKDKQQAQDLLDRAELTGDASLARAVAAVAASRGYVDVLEHYGKTRPEAAQELQQLSALEATPAHRLAESFALSAPPRPPEVTHFIENKVADGVA